MRDLRIKSKSGRRTGGGVHGRAPLLFSMGVSVLYVYTVQCTVLCLPKPALYLPAFSQVPETSD